MEKVKEKEKIILSSISFILCFLFFFLSAGRLSHTLSDLGNTRVAAYCFSNPFWTCRQVLLMQNDIEISNLASSCFTDSSLILKG